MGRTSEDATNRHPFLRISTEHKQKPAIAVRGSANELNAIVRTLLRANRHDYFVFVVVGKSSNAVVSGVVEKFDAAIVASESTDGSSPSAHVERIARSLGFPGVLYASASDERIDFARSEEVIEETTEFGVEAPLLGGEGATAIETAAAIPAFNEEQRIDEVVTDVQRWVDAVIVVDDGSVDDTVVTARRAGAIVIEHGINRGYGAALQTAISEANRRDVEELVVLDGDGQHDPDDIPKLLRARRETDANVVVGSRFLGDGKDSVPWYRRCGLWVINVLTNLSLGAVSDGSWVSDTQSGFRVYDSDVIQSLALDETISDGMGASTDILYHVWRHGYDVAEVETTIRYEDEATSTQNPVLHGLSLVNNILKTVEHDHPMTAFGLPGLGIAFVGLGTGYWSVLNYLQSETLPAGLVLLCIFCTFVGGLLSVTGIVLHSMNLHLDHLGGRTERRIE